MEPSTDPSMGTRGVLQTALAELQRCALAKVTAAAFRAAALKHALPGVEAAERVEALVQALFPIEGGVALATPAAIGKSLSVRPRRSTFARFSASEMCVQ
jgi:hypothetical protein